MGTYHGRLRINKRLEMPRNFIFYDTETSQTLQEDGSKKHYLKLGVACFLRLPFGRNKQLEEWLHFTDTDSFWSWVESKFSSKTRIYLIAHNQQFDAPVVNLFEELPKRGWVLDYNVIDSNLFIMRFRKETTSLVALDTLNWFKFSLKKLAEYVGLKKLEIDFKTCSDKELDVYSTNDVAILKDTMLKWLSFIRENDLGCFQTTIAGQAFTAFRHKYMKEEIFIHDFEAPTLLERESFRGGRNEAFKLGVQRENMTLLDFNSLYPSVMIEHEYPIKFISYVSKATKNGLYRALSNYLVIARVNVTLNEAAIGLHKERLEFPIGTFNVALTSPELLYVIKNGTINKVYSFAIYTYAKIFKDYIEDLYRIRLEYKQEKNVVGDMMTKLFLNSLYGKFGQRVEEQELIGHSASNEISVEGGIIHETKERVRIKTFAGNVYKVHRGEKEGTHSFPAIASFVTAYARMKLWNAMKLAGLENVYYVDTDSLIVNEEGLKGLSSIIDKEKLGFLKVEGNGTDLVIEGLKDYFFLGESKIKGVKKDATKIGLTSYKQPQFSKFRSMLMKGSLDAPVEREVTKLLRRKYLKGIVKENGDITPFILNEV